MNNTVLKVATLTALLTIGIILGSKAVLSNMAPKMFEKAVAERMAANPLAELEDGMHVILIGTGSPLADPTRAGPSTAIVAGGKLYIVDSGGGSVRKMGELGIAPAQVQAAFLTHFHSDHIDGLGELMLQRWAGGAHKTPLPVYGPDGVEHIIEGLNMVYAQDKDYRIAHHGEAIVPPSGFGGIAMPFNINKTSTVFEDGELRVSMFKVTHDPVHPAIGYRFQYKNRAISLTGDTSADENLSIKLSGSDIIISEALNPDMVGVMETAAREADIKNIAKIMKDIPDYHMSPEEAAKTAQDAGVELLVLTHIVPSLPNKALYKYFLGNAPSEFEGDIVIGEDGMIFSLPPRQEGTKSTIIDISRLN